MNNSNDVPITGLRQVCRGLADARTLPGAVYTSQSVYRLEQQAVFSSMWVMVCRQEDLADPGDFQTLSVAGDSLLLTRAESGALHAFYNVCRHRGACLLDVGSGSNQRRISCPYHGWTYAADGRLINAPLMGENFDNGDYGLVAVQLAEYAGFVFVNLDPGAEPLDDCLADLPDLSRYRLRDLRRGKRVEYVVNANWKFIIENYSECYHCALVHPQLNRITDFRSGGQSIMGRCFNGGPMRLNAGFTTLSMSGQSTLPRIPGLAAEDHELVQYFCIYPNFLLSPHPDYVLVHSLWPLGPGQTRVVCDWLFPDETLDTSADISDVVDFWDITNRQDWALCERAQRGAESRGYRPGPYNQLEVCVHEFDRWYAKKLLAARVHPHVQPVAGAGSTAVAE